MMAHSDFPGKSTDEVTAMLQAVLREVLDGGWSVHVSEVQFGYRNIGVALVRPRRRGARVRKALIDFGCLAGFHKNAPKVEGDLKFRVRAFSSAPVDFDPLHPTFTTYPAVAIHARRILSAEGRRLKVGDVLVWRETTTQWVDSNGNRWRKPHGALCGGGSFDVLMTPEGFASVQATPEDEAREKAKEERIRARRTPGLTQGLVR